jgi:ribonucleotide reductase beta subunit family protein with ferritin-like domain
MKENKKTIINLSQDDFTKEPIFFGNDLGLQRYDKYRYPNIFNLFKTQLGFFWRPEEVSVQKDRSDYLTLTEQEKFIFTKNLGYQILLDSVQARGIKNLTEHMSNLESEAFANSWEFFETLHSYSYTYVIKAVYSNPSEVFDKISQDKAIEKRTTSVTKYYDDLIEAIPEDGLDNMKKKLYLTLMSINILEGIRFYVSFACSYAFAQNKKMEGNAKIITLINRDENLHLGFTQFIINKLASEESEGFLHIVEECKPLVIQMFKDAAEEEIEWANYLFENGSLLGLNAQILTEYMKWLTNSRMRSIHLEPIFENAKNTIPWIKNWTESKGVQVAPQESEIESYVVGNFKNDLDNTDFGEFDM